MGKVQVTFAVQASGIERPLPEPILLAVLRQEPGEWVVDLLSGFNAPFKLRSSVSLGRSPISANRVDMLMASLTAELYDLVARLLGVQAEFEISGET